MTGPQVRGQIDSPQSVVMGALDPAARGPVRERAEDQLRAAERSIVARNEAHFAPTEPGALTALRVGSGESQAEMRVRIDERAELAPRVPTGSEYTHRYLMHTECILLQEGCVNGKRRILYGEESAMIDFRPTARRRNVPRSSQGKRRVTKRERHTAIRDLIAGQVVGSQEELRLLLRGAGWDVTQSTLSRDLREMRVARVPTTEGPRYATPETLADGTADRTLVEDILPQFFSSVDGVGELMVLKTIYGGAQPVAEAIDDAGWKEVVGTIGGENTILVICRSAAARETVEKRLVKIANG